jgi:hypothetical protein
VKKTAKTAAKKPVPKTAKKVTLDDVWANFDRIQKAHAEGMKELREAHKETEKALGRLSNKMGDMAEYTLLPNLPEKFKKFGFTFQVINRNRKIADEEHGIFAEVDAFLENGSQAMAVEVKTTLRHEDVDDHVKRMEKIRRYADLHNDKREFSGAIAATVIDEDTKRFALKQGFYVIEPSGEDVKILKPASAKIW